MAQTEDGRLLRTVEQTSPGGRFTLPLADGRIRASVEAIERTGPGGGEGGSHERKEWIVSKF